MASSESMTLPRGDGSRSVVVATRLDPEAVAAIQRLADDHERSRANMAQILLQVGYEVIARVGYEAWRRGAYRIEEADTRTAQ
jgi:predicted transcriptional regulator